MSLPPPLSFPLSRQRQGRLSCCRPGTIAPPPLFSLLQHSTRCSPPSECRTSRLEYPPSFQWAQTHSTTTYVSPSSFVATTASRNDKFFFSPSPLFVKRSVELKGRSSLHFLSIRMIPPRQATARGTSFPFFPPFLLGEVAHHPCKRRI